MVGGGSIWKVQREKCLIWCIVFHVCEFVHIFIFKPWIVEWVEYDNKTKRLKSIIFYNLFLFIRYLLTIRYNQFAFGYRLPNLVACFALNLKRLYESTATTRFIQRRRLEVTKIGKRLFLSALQLISICQKYGSCHFDPF